MIGSQPLIGLRRFGEGPLLSHSTSIPPSRFSSFVIGLDVIPSPTVVCRDVVRKLIADILET